MRPLSRLFMTAFCAVVWTGSASAGTPGDSTLTPNTAEPSAFAAHTEMQLESAFEKSADRVPDDFLGRLAGPTSMDCKNELLESGLETCVVTAEGKRLTPVPATLAQH